MKEREEFDTRHQSGFPVRGKGKREGSVRGVARRCPLSKPCLHDRIEAAQTLKLYLYDSSCDDEELWRLRIATKMTRTISLHYSIFLVRPDSLESSISFEPCS